MYTVAILSVNAGDGVIFNPTWLRDNGAIRKTEGVAGCTWEACLKVLPAASKTTAKCVGGGSNSSSVRRVRMKANRIEVSSPVWVVSLTVFMPK